MNDAAITYEIVYSVGTSRHDERRYAVRAMDRDLAKRITSLQSKGKRIYEVRIAHN